MGEDANMQRTGAVRVAVVDHAGVVQSIALVGSGWAEQDPASRWQPNGEAILLDEDDQDVGPGWRRKGDGWIESRVPAAPQSASVVDGTTEYGKVDEVGPPILVTITRTGEQVQAGRLAGYTPEVKHMVKLTRLSGQWVVEDRVLLADA